VEDWLKWKDALSSWWVKTGAIAAVAAAILAALAWRDPMR
jgi:hypothetical protein